MYDMAPYAAEGGGKKKSGTKKTGTKKLNEYQKFIQACSQTPAAKTRSGTDMLLYCVSEWNKEKRRRGLL